MNEPAIDEFQARQAAVEQYVRTGNYEVAFSAWPGSVWDRERQASDDMVRALVARVKELSRACSAPMVSMPTDLVAYTRKKLEPMVRGLSRYDEQESVLAVLEKSVVFLTSGNMEEVLLGCTWLHTAWDLANLYLGSIGASLLGPDAEHIVGLSEETTCYVSTRYFEADDPFEDFIVHEAAHIFHNCKRDTVGLPETKKREWLLDIKFQKRETFAYACEAYACILQNASRFRDRAALAAKYASKVRISAEGVDASEVSDILAAACLARNGWKIILQRCAPEKR
jgi:hypothetical protein